MASKQPSRKGKKAWRRNVDVSDVHEGLEQLRDEIIQGGVIKEKPDSQLFTLDTAGDVSIAKEHFKTAKVLKVDEILAARSAVPPVVSRKRHGTTDGVLPARKRRSNGVSRRELERLRGIAYGRETAPGKASAPGSGGVDYDPWAEEMPEDAKEAEKLRERRFSFIPRTEAVKAPKTLKEPPVSLAESGRPVPAVRVPDAGISYNPEFAQWDELLQKEGEKEVVLERKRLAEKEEERRIRELAAQADPEEEEYETEAESEGEKPVRKMPERKTQAQRNKIKRQKQLERTRAQEQRLKKQTLEFSLVKKYTKDVEVKEKLRIAKQEAKLSVNDDEKNPKLMRKKKFGKSRIPRAPLELQLPEELADSLRTLKPEGNLLRDRMRSLRERGVLETRLPVTQRRKYQKKVSEKWSYKDFK